MIWIKKDLQSRPGKIYIDTTAELYQPQHILLQDQKHWGGTIWFERKCLSPIETYISLHLATFQALLMRCSETFKCKRTFIWTKFGNSKSLSRYLKYEYFRATLLSLISNNANTHTHTHTHTYTYIYIYI